MEKEIMVDRELIAYCGLYCGACGKYMNGKCPGCRKNEKAKWCKIRVCCMDNGNHTCAQCNMNPHDCKKFNNIFSKFFAFVFKSDREACLRRINEIGEEEYAKDMAVKRIMTLRKGK